VQVCGYFPAPLLDEAQDAYFFVSPVDEALIHGGARILNAAEAALRIAAELYPGRHTLICGRRKSNGELITITRGGAPEEGWCRHASDILAGCGRFAEDRDIRILNLNAGLLDALRVMLDVEVTLNGMSEEDAVAYFQERSAMSEDAAQREVRLIGCNPTISVPSFAGKMLLGDLVENWKKSHKQKKIATFYEKYFSLSMLPPVKIRRNLMSPAHEEEDSSAD
jgi:uncharacterized protein (DUF885 family)